MANVSNFTIWDFPLFPTQASTQAPKVDALTFSWTLICGLVELGVVLAILVFAVRYRRGSSARRPRTPLPIHRIEWTWTLLPVPIFLGMFAWAGWTYYQDYNPPPGAMEIYVVGKQWMWKVQHPEGRREINELHVPVDTPVKLLLSSQDVIHSFYVPAFRMKQDALPGRFTAEWFQATKTGEFHLFCAEYCGTSHSRMEGRVVVMTPDAYQRWLSETPSQPSLVARGARLFRGYGCSGCHGANPAVHAPPLQGIYGKPVALDKGGTVIADDAYLHDSILLSTKQVVAGYKPVMPIFRGQIPEEDVLALVAYVKSLTTNAPETSPLPERNAP